MKVAILGFGVEGQGALRYWQAKGDEITICDQNPDLVAPKDVSTQLGMAYLANLAGFDLIVRTPSIRPDKIAAANPADPAILDRVTSNVREFMAQCPVPIIGVTGTKGKGTTATLISKMLEAAGKTVHLAGNIGLAPLDVLASVKEGDYVVLELSSFQLIDTRQSPHIAVCLMIAPDHLNWHTDMAEYTEAKAQIFTHQTKSDISVYYAQNDASQQIGIRSVGRKVPYFDISTAHVDHEDGDCLKVGDVVICKLSEVGLLGPHNVQNICAALNAVWTITQDATALATAIKEFKGLEHRIEYVATKRGIKYINDSFAVQPEAAAAAIESFSEPKILILGGSDKGSPYDHLASVVKTSNVRDVILIGATAEAIAAALDRVGFTKYLMGPDTMPMIVHAATAQAQPGDVVLLSTACASFDMFKDYKDRGNQFKTAVLALENGDE